MLSIDVIRNNPQAVKQAAEQKNRPVDVEKLLFLDKEVKKLEREIQLKREKRNELAALKQKPSPEIIAEGKALKEAITSLEKDSEPLKKELEELLLTVPNIPLPEVPIGKDESANVVLKTHGTIREFSFPFLTHEELTEKKDLVDFAAGSKVSGFRGYFLKGKLAQLHFALLFYVFQKLVAKGYTPLIAPSLVKSFAFYGNGQFPWGKEEVYKAEDDVYLAGTAEVPVMAMHKDTVFKESELPKKYVAFSPCFRREAGSYGKDTKGLYRVHEFYKIEQVIIAPNNLESARELHEELQRNAEEILNDLGLPYRVLLMCTGDMGEPQIKKYDTEVWMPSRNAYGETMSNSIMGDFQCRRLNIRYQKATGEREYCFSLNNTALASPRILIPLLELNQQEDGTITVPSVLTHLTGFSEL